VLVDAPSYDIGPESPYYIPDYLPPPGLFARLAELDVALTDIRHLIITHTHWDHYNGAVVAQNGFVTPAFPNARSYIGRGDWENAKLQESLRDETSADALTLGVLYKAGLVELVAQPQPIAVGVSVLPAPGESPGHQVVRVESEGEVLYCVGDLYHHPIEVEMGEWMTPWADRTSNLASRRILVDAALRENAWLFASHIPGLGKLAPRDNGVIWVA
jgi:glyoxylase-like metal-dependent hydrolase (beta-lactamase superfamily II)